MCTSTALIIDIWVLLILLNWDFKYNINIISCFLFHLFLPSNVSFVIGYNKVLDVKGKSLASIEAQDREEFSFT